MKGIPSLGPWPRTQVILATDIWLGLMVDLVPSLRNSASSYVTRVNMDTREILKIPDILRVMFLCTILLVMVTSLRVTNSASRPTRSPTCGISFSISGIKVVCVFRCFRASEASASSTLASIGFLTGRENAEKTRTRKMIKGRDLRMVAQRPLVYIVISW